MLKIKCPEKIKILGKENEEGFFKNGLVWEEKSCFNCDLLRITIGHCYEWTMLECPYKFRISDPYAQYCNNWKNNNIKKYFDKL